MLHPPPPALDYRCDEYGDFVLSVGRLDRAKRVDLLLEAAAAGDGLEVVVAGDGPDKDRLERIAQELGLDGRVKFAGSVETPSSPTSMRVASPSITRPIDEDHGFVPYEAFLSEKPVVTTVDAGGPLEIVADGENGRVCEPSRARRGRSVSRGFRASRPGSRLRARRVRSWPSRSPGTVSSNACFAA